jgi:transcriptional regulator with XRE-family HTH domain
MMRIMAGDPFQGLGKALAQLRKLAGFSTQTKASEALKIDKGQLSRWENENPYPTLENLGRVLAGYGATVTDLGEALASVALEPKPEPEGLLPVISEHIRSLAEAVHRVEAWQAEAEERLERLEEALRIRSPS